MWAAKLPGEGAALYDACEAMCSVMNVLGIAIDGGKDSLSMAARLNEEVIKAPGWWKFVVTIDLRLLTLLSWKALCTDGHYVGDAKYMKDCYSISFSSQLCDNNFATVKLLDRVPEWRRDCNIIRFQISMWPLQSKQKLTWHNTRRCLQGVLCGITWKVLCRR